jgi:ribosome-associated protein
MLQLQKKRQRRGNLDSNELAREIVDVAADKMGSDIILLDIRAVSLLADYFVICTADSDRQLDAIREAITEKVKELGAQPLGVEGVASSGWVLIDCGGVVTHIFAPEQRLYYQLEHLWSGAVKVVHVQ